MTSKEFIEIRARLTAAMGLTVSDSSFLASWEPYFVPTPPHNQSVHIDDALTALNTVRLDPRWAEIKRCPDRLELFLEHVAAIESRRTRKPIERLGENPAPSPAWNAFMDRLRAKHGAAQT